MFYDLQKTKLKRYFNRYIRVFTESMTLTISTLSSPKKRVGLLDRSTPASPSREPSPHRSGSPTDGPNQRRRKKEKDHHLHIDETKPQKVKT
jgi:hypothetical protein